jgi:hypothetical protein
MIYWLSYGCPGTIFLDKPITSAKKFGTLGLETAGLVATVRS